MLLSAPGVARTALVGDLTEWCQNVIAVVFVLDVLGVHLAGCPLGQEGGGHRALVAVTADGIRSARTFVWCALGLLCLACPLLCCARCRALLPAAPDRCIDHGTVALLIFFRKTFLLLFPIKHFPSRLFGLASSC